MLGHPIRDPLGIIVFYTWLIYLSGGTMHALACIRSVFKISN